jgi:hypothetical protein
VELATVPVIIRARSEARNTAAFAVSNVLAGTFKKLRLAIIAIICSFVTFILLGHRVHAGPVSARQKYLRALGRELFGDRGAHATSGTEHDGVLSL